MAFTLPGTGDVHELRARLHFLDGGAADIAHRRAQAAHQLMHDAADRAAIRHAALDALGHELVGIGRILEVAILAALFHRAEAAHAAIALVAAALEQLDLAGRFFGTGEQPTDHDR